MRLLGKAWSRNAARPELGAPRSPLRLPRGLGPLRSTDYALYLSGNTLSFIGSQAESMASPWLLYQLTDSPVLLGLNGLFLAVPIFLAVPFAGALADRTSPRRVLIVADALALANSVGLGTLVALGWVQAWHIYTQTFLQATVAGFDVTARQALFPRLAPPAQLDHAVNLNFTSSRIGMLGGPSVGGILIAGLGPASPFFFNAVTFAVMLAAVLLIHQPRAPAGAATGQSVRDDMLAGLAFIRRSEVISAIMLFAALWGILSQNTALLTVFAEDVLEVGPQGLGFLLSAGAAGQLAGSLGLLGLGEVRRKGALLFGVGGLYTAAMIGFAFSSFFLLSAALLVLSGAATAIFSATRHVILQRAAPDHMRGRVMGAHLLVTRGVNPLSQTASGILVGLLGPPIALLAATLALGAVTAAIAVGSSALRDYIGEEKSSSG